MNCGKREGHLQIEVRDRKGYQELMIGGGKKKKTQPTGSMGTNIYALMWRKRGSYIKFGGKELVSERSIIGRRNYNLPHANIIP